MKKRIISLFLCIAIIASLGPMSVMGQVTVLQTTPSMMIPLTDWKINPSGETTTDLGVIPVADASAPTVNTSSWIDAKAPGTVLGALLDAGKYDFKFAPDNEGKKDVFFADNLYQIPYSDFASPWWHSTDFVIPASEAEKKVTLTFKGISYSADIYVNGQKISNKYVNITDETELMNYLPEFEAPIEPIKPSSVPADNTLYPYRESKLSEYADKFIGTFRTYELDITEYLNAAGTSNNIKLLITRPYYNGNSSDFTAFWVDWNPQPPDSMMGLYGDVFLTTSGNVRLSNPAVVSDVAENHSNAALTFVVDVNNLSAAPISGTLTGVVKNPAGETVLTLSKDVVVAANAYCQEIAIEQTILNPELWWPYMSGGQPLYTVDYTFKAGTETSDSLRHRFGIREITTEINLSEFVMNSGGTEQQALTGGNGTLGMIANMMQIYVNHRPVMLKGGGYCPTDLFLRHSQRTNEAVVDYIKYMGMNMIRDEGKFFDRELLDLFDENGILIMVGWCCCDRFQAPHNWTKAERFVAYEMQYAQVRNLRSHPAMALWYNGSDNPPGYSATSGTNSGATALPADKQVENGKVVERSYFKILADLRWPDMGAICSSGSALISKLTNVTGGHHMDATYDTQTPTFYFSDPKGMYAFVSEGGGGASLPVIETINKIIPKDKQWPYNTGENFNYWNYHTARGSFATLGNITMFVDNTYGPSESLEEYIMRTNIYEYDAQRSQYEAINKNRFKSTSGIVNWMLNNAWPMLYWSQFDFYMNPNGSTFGARKGNEPVHIMYDVFKKDIYVVNSTLDAYSNLTAKATIYDIDGNIISAGLEKTLNVAPDGVSPTVAYNPESELISRKPLPVGLEKNAGGSYVDHTYNFFGKIEEAYGVNQLWSNDDVMNALIKPTTAVYFLKLELTDEAGTVVSTNSYPIGMKNDIAQLSGHNWSRSPIYQTADLTLLNTLPAVNISLTQKDSKLEGDKIIQTIEVKNNTNAVAYAVELKAYTNAEKKDLVAPVLYEDNLFTLFPNESRVITITHNARDLNGDAVITANCYNNVINRSARVPTLRTSRSLTLGSASANVVASSGSNTTRATNIDALNATNAPAMFDNVRDADFTTYWANTAADTDPTIYVNLTEPKAFDRITLRWVSAVDLSYRPNNVVIEKSDDGVEWTQIAAYDNTKAAAVMTDIILNETCVAQYIRVKPTGYRSAAPAVGLWPNNTPGAMNSRSGIAAVNAATTFRLAAFEVYAFQNSAFIDIVGDGGVAVGDLVFDATMNANQRLEAVNNGQITLKLSDAPLQLLQDGASIIDKISAENEVSLTGITKDTEIKVVFAELVDLDITPDSIVEGLAANILVSGADIDGASLYLVDGGVKIGAGTIVNGKGILKIAKAPAATDVAEIIAVLDGVVVGKGFIAIISLPENIWAASLGANAGENLAINFNTQIALTDNAALTVGETVFVSSALALDGNTVSCANNYAGIAAGTAISVSGVKYPQLFPAYSFTFKFTK